MITLIFPITTNFMLLYSQLQPMGITPNIMFQILMQLIQLLTMYLLINISDGLEMTMSGWVR